MKESALSYKLLLCMKFLFPVSAVKVEEGTKAAGLCCSAGLSPHTDALGLQQHRGEALCHHEKGVRFRMLSMGTWSPEHTISSWSRVLCRSQWNLAAAQWPPSCICISSGIVESQISSPGLAQCRAREAWASTQLAVMREQKQAEDASLKVGRLLSMADVQNIWETCNLQKCWAAHSQSCGIFLTPTSYLPQGLQSA